MISSIALSFLIAAAPKATDASGIQWVHDNWAAAQSDASRSKRLIAVDVWATWCHTCLSMKNFTLKEKPLAAAKDKLTWLSLDYDKEKNAEFFSKYPVTAFPTFMVIDPQDGSVVGRWVGSGTAREMAAFFLSPGGEADVRIKAGQRALARGDYTKARKIYEVALREGKADALNRTKVLSGYMESLWKTDKKACGREGFRYLGETNNSVAGLDFVSLAFYCAGELPKGEKTALLKAVRDRLRPVLEDQSIDLSVDDRSSVYGVVLEAMDALGEGDAAQTLVTRRLALLEAAAKKAPKGEARATFDYHRMDAYLRLKQYKRAERMLRASEKALPADFNPPWRLSKVYLAQGKLGKGLAAIERALKVGYGGRKVRLYSAKIDLLIEAKRFDDARAVIAQCQEEMKKMPQHQIRPYWRKEFESKVSAVEEKSPAKGPDA